MGQWLETFLLVLLAISYWRGRIMINLIDKWKRKKLRATSTLKRWHFAPEENEQYERFLDCTSSIKKCDISRDISQHFRKTIEKPLMLFIFFTCTMSSFHVFVGQNDICNKWGMVDFEWASLPRSLCSRVKRILVRNRPFPPLVAQYTSYDKFLNL